MRIDSRFCPGDTVWTSEYSKGSGWNCFKSEVIANDATYYRNEALEKSDKMKNEELIKELKRLLER